MALCWHRHTRRMPKSVCFQLRSSWHEGCHRMDLQGREDRLSVSGCFSSREERPPSTACAPQVFQTSRHSRSPVSGPDATLCVGHTLHSSGQPCGKGASTLEVVLSKPRELKNLPKAARFWAELGFWSGWFASGVYVLFASGWEREGWTWWGSPVIFEASGLQM